MPKECFHRKCFKICFGKKSSIVMNDLSWLSFKKQYREISLREREKDGRESIDVDVGARSC